MNEIVGVTLAGQLRRYIHVRIFRVEGAEANLDTMAVADELLSEVVLLFLQL